MRNTEKTIMKSVFGSQLYGLATPLSDTDYKGIFIPDHRQLTIQKATKSYSSSTGDDRSKNTSEDIDLEMFSLHEFIKLACEGQTVAIDMLHTPDDMLLVDSEIWQKIRGLRHKFYTTNMVAYIGYVRKQAAKYGVKGTRLEALGSAIDEITGIIDGLYGQSMDPSSVRVGDIVDRLSINKYCFISSDKKNDVEYKFYQVLEKKFQFTLRITEYRDILQKIYDTYGERAKQARENEGIDWKAISHAIRAGIQLKEIYETNDLVYPLKEREFILKVKRGELDFMSEVKPYLEELVADVERIAAEIEAKGTLPPKADIKFWDEFVYQQYVQHIGNERFIELTGG